MRQIEVKYVVDEFPENPAECSSWTVISFNRKHYNYKDPSNLLDLALRRKISCGTAFVLSAYEHGGISWSLSGEGMQCQFDTARVAGLLIWNGHVKDLPKGVDARRAFARSFLGVYNDWCNGNVYGFEISETVNMPCGHAETNQLDSCYGYYGIDRVREAVEEILTGLGIDKAKDAVKEISL
jgi:hypothetical protein